MTFNEFIELEFDNSSEIFGYYLNYFDELSSNEFPYSEFLKLNGAANKFIECIRSLTYLQKEQIDEYKLLTNELKNSIRIFQKGKNRNKILVLFFPIEHRKQDVQDIFADYYTKTVELINTATEESIKRNDLKLNGFYQPQNSNKKKIKELIEEAVGLIEDDQTITEKTKKQITDYLNKAIRELDDPNTNWSKFVGRIKEIIIVLGALGSLVGDVSPLFQARDKLEESTIIIQQTSININYNILSKTFNSNTVQKIAPFESTDKLLGQKNSDVDEKDD
jgi:hypothetical protein